MATTFQRVESTKRKVPRTLADGYRCVPASHVAQSTPRRKTRVCVRRFHTKHYGEPIYREHAASTWESICRHVVHKPYHLHPLVGCRSDGNASTVWWESRPKGRREAPHDFFGSRPRTHSRDFDIKVANYGRLGLFAKLPFSEFLDGHNGIPNWKVCAWKGWNSSGIPSMAHLPPLSKIPSACFTGEFAILIISL